MLYILNIENMLRETPSLFALRLRMRLRDGNDNRGVFVIFSNFTETVHRVTDSCIKNADITDPNEQGLPRGASFEYIAIKTTPHETKKVPT